MNSSKLNKETDYNAVIRHFEEINEDIERVANESLLSATNVKLEKAEISRNAKKRGKMKVNNEDFPGDTDDASSFNQRKNGLIVALNRQIKSLSAEYEAARKKCISLEAEKVKTSDENAKLNDQLKKLKKQMAEKQEALNEEKQKNKEIMEKFASAQQTKNQLENDYESLRRENQTLKEEKSRCEQKVNRLITQMAKSRQNAQGCPPEKAALMLRCISKQKELIALLTQQNAGNQSVDSHLE